MLKTNPVTLAWLRESDKTEATPAQMGEYFNATSGSNV
jgi:hypothetical protein